MSYSRRQLYAMGEPLGESVTRRKAGGGLILGDGGGNNNTPQNTTVSSTELPAWATGYAKDTLANAANLTDINKNPYKTYDQPRIAGFSPMQEQAQTAASNMSAGPEAFGQNVSSYMSPYMQNVVDVQKQEAARQSGIMGTQQQAQAAQAGAFGGSRDAIMRAERERNLGQQMNQIQAQGSQAAYDQAANQFRQGITQDVAINQLQNQYGGQQQQLAQQGLNTNYQDFLNQQNYPYKQIGFMSDLVRGLPLGQQSTQQMYQAPPSMIQNVGALGMGAYGINQLMKADGGQVKSYADGGDVSSMDDPNQMTAAVAKLTDEQLQQIVQHPASAAELQAAKLELATRASERGGLAGAYNMAHGGMVAFAHGGIPRYDGEDGSVVGGGTDYTKLDALANNYDSAPDEENDDVAALGTDQIVYSPGDEDLHRKLGQKLLTEMDSLANRSDIKLRSDKEMEDAAMSRYGRLNDRIGGNKMYTDIQDQITKMRGENEGALSEGKGLAALQAAGAMLQGNDPMRGLGAAGAAFASSYAPALAAKRRADQSFTEMNINLAKAQRAEKMGLLKEADMYEQSAEKNKIDAYKAETASRKLAVEFIPPGLRATRGIPTKLPTPVKPSVYEEYFQAPPAKRAAMERFANITHPAVAAAGVTQAGATERQGPALSLDIARLYAGATEKATANVDKSLFRNSDWVEAGTAANKVNSKGETQDQVRRRLINEAVETEWSGIERKLSGNSNSPPPTAKGSGTGGANTAPAVPPNATAADLKDGQVYKTARGNAKWNSKTQTFTPVSAQ